MSKPWAATAVFACTAVAAGTPQPARAADPQISVTAHTMNVHGTPLKYHATAGYLIIGEEEGKGLDGEPKGEPAPKGSAEKRTGDSQLKDAISPKAKIFFVAYTLDNVADAARRPLTFVFNGGPGEASVWLHMGSVAPRRVKLSDAGERGPFYETVDNEDTWLDSTDLVFIDPVSTGYSRASANEDVRQFHGLKEDIASVGEFIRLFTTRNGRWLSPKMLLGESYGTTRAAGLADYLQNRHGLYFNGIILISPALSMQAILFTPQNDEPYVSFLPTYSTIAWYHDRLSPDLQSKSVEEIASQARAFAGNEYQRALAQGDNLSEASKRAIATDLARLTGISAEEFVLLNLRIKPTQFSTELLKHEGLLVGAMDARYTGPRYSPGEDGTDEYDPSDEAIHGSFAAAFNDYVHRDLKFETDIPYETSANVRPWSFGDARYGFPNTAEALRKAMVRNPYLNVWVLSGYYDGLTPFFSAENVAASMKLGPARRENLRLTHYPTGHMPYLLQASREQMKLDFQTFLAAAMHVATMHSATRSPAATQ